MKKIEAIINRKNYPVLREKLDSLGIDIIDKRNLEDSKFISESKGSRAVELVLDLQCLQKLNWLCKTKKHVRSWK